MQTNVKCCWLLNTDLLHLVQKDVSLYVRDLFSCDIQDKLQLRKPNLYLHSFSSKDDRSGSTWFSYKLFFHNPLKRSVKSLFVGGGEEDNPLY